MKKQTEGEYICQHFLFVFLWVKNSFKVHQYCLPSSLNRGQKDSLFLLSSWLNLLYNDKPIIQAIIYNHMHIRSHLHSLPYNLVPLLNLVCVIMASINFPLIHQLKVIIPMKLLYLILYAYYYLSFLRNGTQYSYWH